MIVDCHRSAERRTCSRSTDADPHPIAMFDLAFRVFDDEGHPTDEVVCMLCVRRQTMLDDTPVHVKLTPLGVAS